MGMRGTERERPSPEVDAAANRDRKVLGAMQAKLFEVWKDLVEKSNSKNATTAQRALVRLGPISEQLRSVTKDHARLVSTRAQTPPKGFRVEIISGTSDEERGTMRAKMEAILAGGAKALTGDEDAPS